MYSSACSCSRFVHYPITRTCIGKNHWLKGHVTRKNKKKQQQPAIEQTSKRDEQQKKSRLRLERDFTQRSLHFFTKSRDCHPLLFSLFLSSYKQNLYLFKDQSVNSLIVAETWPRLLNRSSLLPKLRLVSRWDWPLIKGSIRVGLLCLLSSTYFCYIMLTIYSSFRLWPHDQPQGIWWA